MKNKLHDAVGTIAINPFAEIWGALAVGIFGAMAGFDQFMIQLAGVGIVGAFCVLSTLILVLLVKALVGLRDSKEEEINGLDDAEHGMAAYADFSVSKKYTFICLIRSVKPPFPSINLRNGGFFMYVCSKILYVRRYTCYSMSR